MVQSLTAAFKRPRASGPGAPILSPAQGQAGGGWGIGNNPDITQFRETFQPESGIFSPGYPLVPVQHERTRGWDYPSGFNYIYTPRSYEPVGFAELRALGQETITRLCIETRKDQIEALEWVIKPRDEKNPKAGSEARIQKLTEFWRKPDGYHRFATWLREFLEDMLVIDAPAMELRFNRGGDIIGIDYIDGATIKVLIDETGRRPLPPAPAYEQVIHGRPWVLAEEGRVSTDAKGTPLWDSQILYMPRNPRGAKAYGFSPVEQVLITINTELRRQVMQLQHFTEGNVPPGMISAPDSWNPEQVKQYQEWFDSILAGNTASRTRLLWGPAGAKYQAFKEAPIKDNFDEWLARIICFAFSLPPTAFVQQMNRATAQTAQETALEEGLAPLMGWVKRMVDTVIQDRMGQDDLEFAWSDVRPVDPQEQSVILGNYVKDGIYTLNEARDTLGMDPIEGGDEAMVLLPSGPVLVKDLEQMSAQTVAPPPPPVIMHPGMPGAPGEQGNPPGKAPGAVADQGKPPPSKGKPTPKGGKKPATPAESQPSDAKKPPAAAGKKRPAKKAVGDPEVAKAGASPFGGQERSASRTRAAAQLKGAIAKFFKAEAPRVAADVLRGAAPLLHGVHAAKAAIAKASIDKDEADYVDHPVDGEQCSGCTMFETPNGCSLVRGDIAPDGHCRFFEANEEEPAPTPDDHTRDALLLAALEAALAAIEFARWKELFDEVESALGDVGQDAFEEAMAALGAEPDEAAAQAAAEEYAKTRAAELLGQRVAEDGALVADPTAEASITATTANMIRDEVLDALKTKMTVKDLAQALTASRAFSDDRAELIANHETSVAMHRATLAAFDDSGAVEASIWATMEDDDVDPDCEENAAAGPVPLGEDFPSGDDAPPAHINCRCWLEPVLNGESGLWSDTLGLQDDEDEEGDEGGEKVGKYSDDQPRDERGRWGSGGSGASGLEGTNIRLGENFNVHADYHDAVVNELKSLGTVAPFDKPVVVETARGGIFDQGPNFAYHTETETEHHIVLNEKLFSGEGLKAELEKQAADGTISSVPSAVAGSGSSKDAAAAVVAHEYGHATQADIEGKPGGREAVSNLQYEHWSMFGGGVSDYTKVSPGEWFADTFAATRWGDQGSHEHVTAMRGLLKRSYG